MDTQQQGHRHRLLQRFTKTGLTGFQDYEIIELLLTFAIPRKDTKLLAKSLIKHFASVNGIFHAATDDLLQFEGVGIRTAHFISLIREIIAYCLCERYEKKPVIVCRSDVEKYLQFYFGQRKDEYVAVLFLDTSNHVLGTEEITEGTVNHCVVYPRTIVQRALKYGASSFIMAHNHPGGNPGASEADWQITKRLYTIGKLLDIHLCDHIIILKNKVISLRDHPRWPK